MAKRKKETSSPDKGTNPGVDFEQLRREIKDATRQTFAAVRDSEAGKRLYAFALYSDGSAMTVCPAANTEDAYKEAIAKAGASEPEDVNYYRWAFPEWGTHIPGADSAFKTICSRLSAAARHDEQDPDGFAIFKTHVYATMVLALLDLVKEGFFGSDPERERLTLLCSEPDSGCAVWLEDESARRLNPSNVYKRFRK